ncbi:hypothetical protein GQ54DRAFT_261036 [Martensiomyces pterosporus]|nr:hypothetical protein GQ54DRAFT_261036 [Martensiomyces pterosporus]
MVSAFLASGWYAVFARGNWIRDRWIRWWAKLPAEVVKAWTTVLENDAHGAVVQLTSGITSDRVIAAALVEDPVKWTGELELLRIISDSNSQLLCYMLEFHPYVDYYDESLDEANIVWPDEFASPKILGCFDLKQELLRWVDRSRYLADPKRDFNLAKDRWAEENLFSPFYYPFLFSMDDKLQLHTVEVHSRMRLRYLSAHDRQAETVQNQRVLNIDAHAEQTVRSSFLPEWPLLASNRLAVASASNPYVVMAMRRDRLVQDAMDMIQANLERLRFPLKVRFVAGGEDGVDMGGVQKEFFALLLPQLLSPERGLFVFANDMAPSNISADSDGRGSGDYLWPNAASPHSLRDFEMVGVFLGIAFNNGISLDSAIAPLAPLLLSQLAFGHPQLDNTAEWPLPTLVNRVRGTFPSLVAGLQQLLEWDEEELGSVEDVFCRAFEVTVPDPLHIWQARRNEAIFGKMASSSAAGGGRQQQMLTAPFDHLPLPNQTDGFVPSDASSMGAVAETATFPLIRDGGNIEVTKSNRRLYVRRYLEFIGYEHARAQIDALRRGFLRAADGITYRMTRTSEFLDWLCGHDADTAIDPKELERVATYDDEYTETHEVVRRFWRIVGGFTQTQLRQLLGFVTASDRLPLGGYRNITFVVQRNGPDTSRLPTALTCFGRLLLPAYGTEEKMRERLLTAIENSSGFGLV